MKWQFEDVNTVTTCCATFGYWPIVKVWANIQCVYVTDEVLVHVMGVIFKCISEFFL